MMGDAKSALRMILSALFYFSVFHFSISGAKYSPRCSM